MEKTSSRAVAFSFAMGTFIAILPTPGFGIFLALLLAYFFKQLNSLSIVVSFAVWNPLLLAPVYLLSYKLGDWIFDPSLTLLTNIAWVNTSIAFLKTYLVGNAIAAVVISTICYFIVYKIMEAYKLKKVERRNNRRIKNITPPTQSEEAA
ncbi:MAG: DUF2062 domain-containing protein [Bacteroidetes bacterium]|nr:DUF2062 domain-containing protein [Bacteroidota bacterium]